MGVVLQDYQKNGTPILTTNKEKRHAYIGEWHSETSDCSFDKEWTSYVARRLLKTDKENSVPINALGSKPAAARQHGNAYRLER